MTFYSDFLWVCLAEADYEQEVYFAAHGWPLDWRAVNWYD
jgi:hypothetical protein